METVNVTVRMERQTRDDAARLFSELGVSTTQAINMFLFFTREIFRNSRVISFGFNGIGKGAVPLPS